MSQYCIKVQDLDDGPRELREPIPDEWILTALKGTEVSPAGTNDGRLDLTLMKNGREILIRGRMEIAINVPCSRTLEPATYRLRPEVFLMLAPGSPSAGSEKGSAKDRSTARHERRARREAGVGKRGAKKGRGGSKGSGGWETDPLLSQEDAAADTYSGDQVVLDDFLREFIILEVPMVPLREDLRDGAFEANPALPEDRDPSRNTADDKSVAADSPDKRDPSTAQERPLDPRLSPLAELKARLENKE